MTAPTQRPRGRPRLTPRPELTGHSWHRVPDETGRERHACAHCGARHGAWLTPGERATAEVVVAGGSLPRRPRPEDACPGEHGLGDRYVLPTGGTVSDRDRAARAWRAALHGPAGRRGPVPSGRVAVGLSLAPAVVAWLRAQPEGVSATVDRLVLEARGERRPCPACGGVGYEVGSDGEREDCVACDPRVRP